MATFKSCPPDQRNKIKIASVRNYLIKKATEIFRVLNQIIMMQSCMPKFASVNKIFDLFTFTPLDQTSIFGKILSLHHIYMNKPSWLMKKNLNKINYALQCQVCFLKASINLEKYYIFKVEFKGFSNSNN